MSNSSWWERAQRVMPGGVNSPVRAFRAVPGEPLFFRDADGSRFADENGSSYLDFCMSWGPLLLGHRDPAVMEAVQEAISEGLTFGAPSRREVLLAEALLARVPVFDQVRFVSSGTEATMSAIRLARGYTGRDAILKFDGCYHGHADHLLVKGGSGLATFGTPSSAGVPNDFSKHTAVLPLDDEAALDTWFAANGDRCAAVIVEPVPANAGLLIPRVEWLAHLRTLCTRHGALLIYDEVITGFRVGAGGVSMGGDVKPDLATYGKVIGGGMPVGAYAGTTEVMSHISPLGPVYQAGTLSGNPVAMAAGLATLARTAEPGFYERLAARTTRLATGIQQILEDRGVEASVVHHHSLFWIAWQRPAPRRYDRVDGACAEPYGRLHRALIEQGVYLAPSAWEVGFVSSAHTDDDITATLEAFGRAAQVLG